MSGDRLIALLEKYGLKEKADKVRVVIKKGLNTYAPSGMLATGDPVIEPKYFIWVIQKSNGEVMDQRDKEFGDDQNIRLHDLGVSDVYAPHRTSLSTGVLIRCR